MPTITEDQVCIKAVEIITAGRTIESAGLGDEMRGRVVELLVKTAGSADTAAFREAKEAKERSISLEQWRDLLHIAKTRKENKEWIDRIFTFPTSVNIETKGDLCLAGSWFTKLPERLSINGGLDIRYCSMLTNLPEDLSVDGDLWLSRDLNEQVKKDARALKTKGNITGKIKYIEKFASF